jgi:hypothetical protein
MFFTWLTGSQSRKQIEKVAAKQDQKTERDRVMQERRNAYFAALELASIDLRRIRYERKGEEQKLAEVEHKWPKRDRVQMAIQATTALEVYGSPPARDFLRQWQKAMSEKELNKVYRGALALFRSELGADALEVSLVQIDEELRRSPGSE